MQTKAQLRLQSGCPVSGSYEDACVRAWVRCVCVGPCLCVMSAGPVETRPLPPVSGQPLLEGALAVAELDLCVRSNGADHSTAGFQRGLRHRALIVRRGQPFRICVRFNRKYTEERDSISLIFTADGMLPVMQGRANIHLQLTVNLD